MEGVPVHSNHLIGNVSRRRRGEEFHFNASATPVRCLLRSSSSLWDITVGRVHFLNYLSNQPLNPSEPTTTTNHQPPFAH